MDDRSNGVKPTVPTAPLVGILAGMGPHSTAPFLDLVIRECGRRYGARHDVDFPPILIYSLPTPFFPDRPLDHEAMESALLGGLLKLQEGGVRFIAMPCNTAHLYHGSLAGAIDVPLLDIVDETLATLEARTRTVALLATEPTVESNLYQEPLRAAGLEVVERPGWQERVTDLIRAIKSSASERDLQDPWRSLLADVRAAGVDTLVVGCTDLRPLLDSGTDGLAAVDSSRCLADSVVRRFLEEAEGRPGGPSAGSAGS